MKLQIAVSRASLIFPKIFPDAVNIYGRLYIASTACTRTHLAKTKQKIIISKIRENSPLKTSYVAPRVLVKCLTLDCKIMGSNLTGGGMLCP